MNFDKEALSWDSERRVKRAKIIADEIIGSVRAGSDSVALEFGCGTGLVGINLAGYFKRLTLADPSQGMISVLNQKIGESGTGNISVLCGDINSIKDLGSFDVIFSSMALHHVEDVRATLGILADKLNPDGYLCIVDLVEDDGSFHKNEPEFNGHSGFDPDDMKALFEDLGLQNVSARVFYNDYKMIGDSRVDYSLFILVGHKRAESIGLQVPSAHLI